MKKREEAKYVTALPGTEECVAMVEFKGLIFVATKKSVYQLVGNVLKPLEFQIEKR